MKLLILSALAIMLAPAPASPPIVGKYEGGRPYYSHLVIELYQDSTFTYSKWYHESRKTNVFKGTWRKSRQMLVLNSCKKKLKPGQKSNCLFKNEAFRIKGDTLKLYSRKDSIERYRFCQEYLTLVRKP